MRLTKKTENGYFHKLFGNSPIYTQKQMISDLDDIVQKLGQLEDIEDELGIDLITLLKALKDGVYYKLNLGQAEKVGDVSLNYCASTGYFIHFEYLNYDICLDTKDYGKTWALTNEESENK